MSEFQVIAVGLATAWLGVLSVVVLLLVRQLGLVTLRLQALAPQFSVHSDGPEIGGEVPDELVAHLMSVDGRGQYILLLAATCTPCRELAAKLSESPDFLSLPLTALVAGPAELAASLIDLLPDRLRVVRDPDASAIAERLGVKSTPFAVQINDLTITGKAYVQKLEDLGRLVEAGSDPNVMAVFGATKEGTRGVG